MRKEQALTEDNIEVVYKPDGPSLQDLMEMLFKKYIQSVSLYSKGETDEEKL